jgi:hypothetical protein
VMMIPLGSGVLIGSSSSLSASAGRDDTSDSSLIFTIASLTPGIRFEGFRARWTPVGLGMARSILGQTSVNPSQTWSTLVKLGQP